METDRKLYNLHMLEDMSGMDVDFIREMVVLFCTNTPVVLDKLHTLNEEQNWDELRHVAHKFLSNVNMIGISSIILEVDLLESNALNRTNLDENIALIERIGEVCIKVIEQLKEEFNL